MQIMKGKNLQIPYLVPGSVACFCVLNNSNSYNKNNTMTLHLESFNGSYVCEN